LTDDPHVVIPVLSDFQSNGVTHDVVTMSKKKKDDWGEEDVRIKRNASLCSVFVWSGGNRTCCAE
jgi:hypothetical protein